MDRGKIVLVTSSQPSLNPRLVKEADTLSDNGFNVVVIGQYWNSWASETDLILLKNKKWKYIQVGGTPSRNRVVYLFSRFVHKVSRKLSLIFGQKYGLAELSVGRCSSLLYRAAVGQKANFYIGHNPGGLAPAIRAAKINGAKCGFDAEDFHRYEYSDDPNHPDVKCKTFLEEKYFPQLDYIITSSFKISEEYKNLFPELKFTTVLNVFPKVKNVDVKISRQGTPLKLFWFSQTIGYNRGLDEAIEAIKIIGSPLVELHALGFPREEVIKTYNKLAKTYHLQPHQLVFYPPIPPDDIYNFASQFDIGLAIEIGKPFNRSICLTNKIFTYIQSGLAVIASDTVAQLDLLSLYPDCGKSFKTKSAKELADRIRYYLDDRGALSRTKLQSYSCGQLTLNWDTESKRFLQIIESTLGQ